MLTLSTVGDERAKFWQKNLFIPIIRSKKIIPLGSCTSLENIQLKEETSVEEAENKCEELISKQVFNKCFAIKLYFFYIDML